MNDSILMLHKYTSLKMWPMWCNDEPKLEGRLQKRKIFCEINFNRHFVIENEQCDFPSKTNIVCLKEVSWTVLKAFFLLLEFEWFWCDN